MIIKKEVRNFLNGLLNLPASGHEQDWEVEMANPNRVKEFIEAYSNNTLTNEQRYALAALILASYEELLYNEVDNNNLWNDIHQILISDKSLFKDILTYWALETETNKENWFNITPLIQSIK